jgi:FixJ family two-component response regulator
MKVEPKSTPIVFVVDDDASMRNALANLFRSVGLQSALFGSGSELLRSKLPDVPSCLVLDIRLPGLSGLGFQAELAKANIHIPIIFMTGHGDIPMSVQAMKAGAVDFLSKPISRSGYAGRRDHRDSSVTEKDGRAKRPLQVCDVFLKP